MRSTKELLEILLDKFSKHKGASGLCHSAWVLVDDNEKISWVERNHLLDYIDINRPNKDCYGLLGGKVIKVPYVPECVFFWKPYVKTPRIKWLKKHIELNSK